MKRHIVGLGLLVLLAACGTEAAPGGPPATAAESVPTTTAPTTATSPPVESTTPVPSTTTLAGGSDGGFPVTVSSGGAELTISARPQRIVSLSATATEILFAIGAGDQVVAVDEFSDFPAEAPTTSLSGFTAGVEALSEFDPDLVVIFFDPGDLAAGLEAVGIPVLIQPAASMLEDTYAQVADLGAATGHREEALALVAAMRADIGQLVERTPRLEPAPTYYHELDTNLFSVTSTTFLGELYGMLGLVNIADPADADGFGYPQLSAEFIIESDPTFVFLADTKCCGVDAAAVAARPGWGTLSAVAGGRVVPLDDDIASRWGPRVVDHLRVVADAVTAHAAGS